MQVLHYVAYGSNLHPVRLTERVPSAILLGQVPLPGYRLAFHKQSKDGSGKGNLLLTKNPGDLAYGALFSIDPSHQSELDRIEGRGYGYQYAPIRVKFHGTFYSCFTYAADPSYINDDLRPYDWYKRLVILGAEHLAFPAEYLKFLERVESIPDTKEDRRQQRGQLINRLIAAN